jgi:predicted dehydrogenase
LIGCGRVSDSHINAYKRIPDVNVIAVSDINLERANIFAHKYRIKKTFDSYSRLFEMKDLDFVDICTPTLTHAEIACDAAKSGHNILLEKPMGRNTAECDKIIHDVEKNHVKLCVGHNQLFIPNVMEAKAKIDSGEFPLSHFGVLVRESAELIGAPKWIMTPEQGGVLWETGTHCAYLQLHFLKKIEQVYAVGVKLKYPVNDHFVAFLKSSEGTTGIIELSFLSSKIDIMFELIGSDGQQTRIRNYYFMERLRRKNPTHILQGFFWDEGMVIRKWTKYLALALRNYSIFSNLPHYIMIGKYVDAIKNDTKSPVTPKEGRDTVRLLECINESLNKNLPVNM